MHIWEIGTSCDPFKNSPLFLNPYLLVFFDLCLTCVYMYAFVVYDHIYWFEIWLFVSIICYLYWPQPETFVLK